MQISINFAAFVPIQNGGRQREVAYDTDFCNTSWEINLLFVVGRGDTISCDYGSLSHTYLPKANASLLVQSHTEVHRIPWKDLLVVLKAYPKFRDNFLNELELAYNLGDTDEVGNPTGMWQIHWKIHAQSPSR